ncbi:orotidine-5'-phosphate decarboxylase [Congregibacter litoralis]|uniref:Orotidine 5'-phosphate decarboxylase n=1 Tax=Congregibacter litoralis KT71 TaxID=314285 RepID=A4AAS3_9GAMM|nr:orotidine-5'-phosphate decarboxylase [Congregibacter litoralis]EAQ96795.1 orotidine-5''-phosphate decarboxylase [Congregibacter litoralis KT71]
MSRVESPVIVALDYPEMAPALELASALDPTACRLKVGKELFTAEGPGLVERLQSMGFEVFLDLKFHDIPNTVAGALRSAADLGVWMVNVHVSGGRRMLEASVEAIAGGAKPPLLIGVTVLTSMDAGDFDELGYGNSLEEQVLRLATLAKDCGLQGVVCSAREAAALRARLGTSFALVTPGIRPAGAVADDQRRILTPAQAIAAGASYLVVGRPITQADDPAAALGAINASL